PRKGTVTFPPAIDVSCAVTGRSGRFDTLLPLHGKFSLDLVQPALYCSSGFVSCQWDTVKFGWMSKASTTTTFPCAWLSCVPMTVIVRMCLPSLRSSIVKIGVWISSAGRAKRSTCRGGPPSTLTVASPMLLPRLPIHRIEVPTKLIVAVAPAAVDCMAELPLHPEPESLFVHAPPNVTAGSDSSTRMPAVGRGAGVSGPLPPFPPVDPEELSLEPPPPPHETSNTPRKKRRTRDTERIRAACHADNDAYVGPVRRRLSASRRQFRVPRSGSRESSPDRPSRRSPRCVLR